jgi:hypothetical protein
MTAFFECTVKEPPNQLLVINNKDFHGDMLIHPRD